MITCTGLELATAIGVSGYLLYLGESFLALISSIVLAKLIAFHFILDWHDKRTKSSILNHETGNNAFKV